MRYLRFDGLACIDTAITNLVVLGYNVFGEIFSMTARTTITATTTTTATTAVAVTN